MASKLTSKQEQFCREYLVDLNATQAAIRSGYSEETAKSIACENLTKPDIQEFIQDLKLERSKRLEITADKVLRDIEETRVRCMQGEPVLDREGNETGEWKFEAHAALKASELQGKHIKMFTEKIEHSGHIKTDSLTDEELDARIHQLVGAKK